MLCFLGGSTNLFCGGGNNLCIFLHTRGVHQMYRNLFTLSGWASFSAFIVIKQATYLFKGVILGSTGGIISTFLSLFVAVYPQQKHRSKILREKLFQITYSPPHARLYKVSQIGCETVAGSYRFFEFTHFPLCWKEYQISQKNGLLALMDNSVAHSFSFLAVFFSF